MNKFGAVSAILALTLIGGLTSRWSVVANHSVSHSQGLLRRCNRVVERCQSMPVTGDTNLDVGALRVVQTCMLLSVLLLGVTLADMYFDPKDRHLQAMMLSAAAGFNLAACGIYMLRLNKIGGTKGRLGMSWWCCILAGVLAAILTHRHLK